jgi:hypothetical protein
MPEKSFLDASEEELIRLANLCHERAGSALLVPPADSDQLTKLHLFLGAQLCLTEVVRKRTEQTAEHDRGRNEEIAERDYRLERWVLILIGIEIVLSLAGLWAGYKQGKVLDQQTAALTHMDTSTAATADSLQKLVADQSKSLARLSDMNTNLQESLKTTDTMAVTTKRQLGILQQDQKDRLAQLAKKPKLVLYTVEGDTLLLTATSPILPRQRTETSLTYDFLLKNDGDEDATRVVFRTAIFAADVSLQTSPPSQHTTEPLGWVYHTSTMPIDLIRPNNVLPISLTFTYPKGHPPFRVKLNIDADKLGTGNLLGNLIANP